MQLTHIDETGQAAMVDVANMIYILEYMQTYMKLANSLY